MADVKHAWEKHLKEIFLNENTTIAAAAVDSMGAPKWEKRVSRSVGRGGGTGGEEEGMDWEGAGGGRYLLGERGRVAIPNHRRVLRARSYDDDDTISFFPLYQAAKEGNGGRLAIQRHRRSRNRPFAGTKRSNKEEPPYNELTHSVLDLHKRKTTTPPPSNKDTIRSAVT